MAGLWLIAFTHIVLFNSHDKTNKLNRMIYPFYRWCNCDLESNETCPKSKADTPICCWTWCRYPQKSCSKPRQAAAPSRDQFKYRAGAPAMEMNATSFNLIGLWPCWATLHDESANQTCPGPGAASCFHFSNITNNKKEKWSNQTQKEARPKAPK